MKGFSLEEFKKRTKKGVERFNNPDNRYRWTIYKSLEGIEHPEDIINTPIFELTTKTLNEHYKVHSHECRTMSHVCFGRFLFYARQVQIKGYRIVFTSLLHKKQTLHGNNFCWMSHEQISFWLDTVKNDSGLDFYYRIKETVNNFQITFDFKELSVLQIKYILFWERYLFEVLLSFQVLDVIYLKRHYFKNESLQNLITLTTNCLIRCSIHPHNSIDPGGNFIDIEELRKRLRQKNRANVTTIFDKNYLDPVDIYRDKYLDFSRYVRDINRYTGEWWLSFRKRRFKVYKDLYKTYKDLEIKYKEEESAE